MHLNFTSSSNATIGTSETPTFEVVDAIEFFDSVLFNNASVSILAKDIEDAVCDGEWLGTMINAAMGITEDDVQQAAEMIHEACNA